MVFTCRQCKRKFSVRNRLQKHIIDEHKGVLETLKKLMGKGKKGGKKEKKESKEEKGKGGASSSSSSSSSSSKVEIPRTPVTISEMLAGFAKNSKYSDCTFVVGKEGTRIPAHKIVVAAASPILELMVYPPEKKDEKKDEKKSLEPIEVKIPDITPEVFGSVLTCIYSDKTAVDAKSVNDLAKAAKQFKIEKLSQVCAKYLDADVSIKNVWDLLGLLLSMTATPSTTSSSSSISSSPPTSSGSSSTSTSTTSPSTSTTSSIPKLPDDSAVMAFIRENIETLVSTPEWLASSRDRIQLILNDDKLCADEMALFDGTLAWAKAEAKRQSLSDKPDDLKKVLAGVLPLIRFPLMEINQIAGPVTLTGLLTSEDMLLLFQFVSMTDLKERAKLPLTWSAKPRESGFLARDSIIVDRKYAKDLSKIFADVKPDSSSGSSGGRRGGRGGRGGRGRGRGYGGESKEEKKESSSSSSSSGGKSKIQFTLLYRRTRDTAKKFHAMCDSKGPTVTFIRSGTNIFGGYNSVSWGSDNNYTYGAGCFLFSLVNKSGKVGKWVSGARGYSEEMCYNDRSSGPTFGAGNDIRIPNSGNGSCSIATFRRAAPGFPSSPTLDSSFLAGKTSWTVDEVEVFAVKF